ncbi:MAG: hypothetical protein WAR24_19290 [Candidatus Acidiferrales bacterium]
MNPSAHRETVLTAWVRWGAVLWLAIWIPAYWRTWGFSNFVHLCDIAVILTCVGLWSSSALLLSSQAVSSLVVDLAWSLDVAWRWFAGHHLIGGTEYLFDPQYPLWVRLLSLFHAAMPFILLAALRRTGYDPAGFALQCAIAAAALLLSRILDPIKNYNFAFRDPILHRAFGPAPVHLAVIFLALLLIYWPTHEILKRLFRPAPEPREPQLP